MKEYAVGGDRFVPIIETPWSRFAAQSQSKLK